MTWYLDTSAVVKLARHEQESTALESWLSGRDFCSSDLLRTGGRRAVVDEVETTRTLLEGFLDRTELIRITPDTFDRAGHLRVATPLRSLDAIHIAAAMQLGIDLDGIVTYDRRMAEAAGSLGIEVAAPGT